MSFFSMKQFFVVAILRFFSVFISVNLICGKNPRRSCSARGFKLHRQLCLSVYYLKQRLTMYIAAIQGVTDDIL